MKPHRFLKAKTIYILILQMLRIMQISGIIIVVLVSACAGLDVHTNCTYTNEIFATGKYQGYPNPADLPLLNRKIIRGTRVSILEHPYIVSIRRQMTHYLTGTLINPNLILTVAHPLVDVPIVDLGVVLGQNYNDRGGTIYTVVLVIIHEKFNHNTLFADLALVKTYESPQDNMNSKLTMKPIRSLLRTGFSLAGQSVSAFVTGWGRCDIAGNELCLPRASKFYTGEIVDPMLRSINIDITDNSPHCDTYGRHEMVIGAGMLCVGPARQADHTCPCLGVPGAPLVVNGKLLGVLSWGFGCGYHTDLPLIYTDVRYYGSWISRNVQSLNSLKNESYRQLYEATKLAIITEWLTLTTSGNVEHEHPDAEIQPWEIDKDLAFVAGDIYDVRDFYGKADYHEEKMKRYPLIQASMMEDPRKSKLLEQLHTPLPPTGPETSNGDSDSDYDSEYDLIQVPYPYTTQVLDILTYTYKTTTTVPSTHEEEYF